MHWDWVFVVMWSVGVVLLRCFAVNKHSAELIEQFFVFSDASFDVLKRRNDFSYVGRWSFFCNRIEYA